MTSTTRRSAEEITAQAQLCDDCNEGLMPSSCPHAYKKGGCIHPEEHENEK